MTAICLLAEADRIAGGGGKAAQLARLARLGLPVPPGLVITDAVLQAFLEHNGLRAEADAVGRMLATGAPEELETAAHSLRQRILAGDMPAPYGAELHSRLAIFAPGAVVIVRSSAEGEDGVAASFAGQLDSILDVDPRAGLLPALRSCWASYWSPRALTYQRSRGIRLRGMGVVVQEQVRPRFAGVLFTVTPEQGSGAPDDVLIEYCAGHAEALVQGRVNPGRVVLRRADLHLRQVTPPEDGEVPETAALVALARAGLTVEAACGRPQDIEWALDAAGRPWLVQARPITTAAPAQVLWSNANVNENYPEPISPLLYSIAQQAYYHYFRNLGLAFGLAPARLATVEEPLQHIIGVHGARMYYHLTNIHSILRAAPFGTWLAQYFSAFTGAEPPAAPKTPDSGWGSCFEAARIGVTAACIFRTLPRRVAEFEQTVDTFAERTCPEKLADVALAELLEALRGFLDIRFNRWTNAGLADAAAMISYGLLKQVLRREFPAAEQAALHNTLLKGLTDVVSGLPQAELWELSRLVRAEPNGPPTGFQAALDRYLQRWGYRRSGELMLTVPDFQEQPGPLLEILRAYATHDGEAPAERLRRQQSERTVETKRVLGILRGRRLWRWLPWPSKASVVRRLLGWCQAAIGLRERARMRQALLYSRCRGIALAIGRRLVERGDFDHADDVFFLTYQEIDEFLSGSAMFPQHVRDLVRLRRRANAEVSAEKPPDVLALPVGAYFTAGRTESPSHAEQAMTGVGACGGQVRGRAAVLEDVTDCSRLAAGDVLVTRQTDPGWGLAFPLIGGLVLERGGMLSHGAILAREYGIPTVVGVREAARRIQSGQILHVDGDRGVVHLVDH